MEHFAGLDVSVKLTSLCIVDDAGGIIREAKVESDPDALLQVLKNGAYHFKRIGLEAGPLSQWLFSALAEAGLPVICVETRHMRAALKAQINKTDRNDARGMAQMMRAGLYRPVHVKTVRSQKLRMQLTHRKLLQSKAIAIENDLRATLQLYDSIFGINVKGMLFTVQKALPLMPDGSAIIVTSSIVGSKGLAANSVYAATKAVARSFARTWTTDLKHRHIRVNAISPGSIDTPGLIGLLDSSPEGAQRRKMIYAATPIGRFGTPDEIAKAAVFLASDDASYVTGIELFVDGGLPKCRATSHTRF